MKSGGGVLCVSVLQLVVGLALLGIYEAYKVSVHRSDRRGLDAPPTRLSLESCVPVAGARDGGQGLRGREAYHPPEKKLDESRYGDFG